MTLCDYIFCGGSVLQTPDFSLLYTYCTYSKPVVQSKVFLARHLQHLPYSVEYISQRQGLEAKLFPPVELAGVLKLGEFHYMHSWELRTFP